jgi:hypothetical protein
VRGNSGAKLRIRLVFVPHYQPVSGNIYPEGIFIFRVQVNFPGKIHGGRENCGFQPSPPIRDGPRGKNFAFGENLLPETFDLRRTDQIFCGSYFEQKEMLLN